ncbi:hypothetical protein GCM10007216_07490 [Thalassobacillus devorans]|uniref:NERD domain-containing protein n=1 Tax=Thalassobacillus devorans TaxID=279813 RepID=A0ABQ1NLJ7_9BACI|nr:nuclease-related domain-containing protein [Thalassobacillus devorans]NIK27660.1 ribosomal protein L37AE/L43A [Thalassobacillus devorans]GGC79527.1 hypothetical protein GCM10007216_07490 [Thalassobacillus devorans]
MIIKKHEMPMAVLDLTAIQRRLPPNHPKLGNIQSDLSLYESGYRGELALDYHLNMLHDKETFLLHGVRLHSRNNFQIDTMVMTPYFFLIIEVKNFTGSVRFDHGFGQMTQSFYGEERSFKDPVIQAENQAFHMQSWLLSQGISGIPVETLVVFVSNHVQLTRQGEGAVDERIIHAGKLREKISALRDVFSYRLLDTSELRKLANRIKRHNQPLRMDMKKKYKLAADDIRPGILCTECGSLPMIRKHGSWQCTYCGHMDNQAHINALKDYKLLFNDSITNKEARWMLQSTDRHIVGKLLTRHGLRHNGMRKNRRYYLEFDYQTDYAYLLK